MRIAHPTDLTAAAEAIRASAGAVVGWPGDLFRSGGETFSARLTVDDDIRFSGRNSGGNIWPLPPVSLY